MKTLGPLQLQILDVLRDAEAPMPRVMLNQKCTLGKSLEAISSALDALQIADLIVREEYSTGIFYRMPLTPAMPPRPQALIAPLQPTTTRVEPIHVPRREAGTREAILRLLERRGGIRATEIFLNVRITQTVFSKISRAMEADGEIERYRVPGHAAFFWRLPLTHETEPTAGATPAAQAQVAKNSASEGAAPVGELPSVTSPSGSRDEPSNIADLEYVPRDFASAEKLEYRERSAAYDARQRSGKWSIEQLAQMRAHTHASAEGSTAAPKVALEFEPFAEEPSAHSIEITDAQFALWSDGRLMVEAGDTHITFKRGAARELVKYLNTFDQAEIARAAYAAPGATE